MSAAAGLLTFLFLIGPQALRLNQAVPISVDSICLNPGAFLNNAVQVSGLVTSYVPGGTGASYYVLRGDHGWQLKVHTSERAPEIDRKYQVTGILYMDYAANESFISEQSRSEVAETGAGSQTQRSSGTRSSQDPVILALTAFILVLVVLLAATLVKRNKSVGVRTSGTSSEPRGETKPAGQAFKMVKVPPSNSRTMKLIPGELVITSGEDGGRSFKIAGYPTPEGEVVTIGRGPVEGERSYAHIQLDGRFSTVSRRQAEFVFRAGILHLRNLSETNFTQIDGRELAVNQEAEVRPGSLIRCGDLELMYRT
jgi:hypothetical protein